MKVPPPHYTKDVPRPRYDSVARAGDVKISTPKGEGGRIGLLLQHLEVTIELTDAPLAVITYFALADHWG